MKIMKPMDEFYFFGSEEVGYGLCQFICHNEEKPVFSFNGVRKKIMSDSLMERFIPKAQYLEMTGTEILVKINYYKRLDNLPEDVTLNNKVLAGPIVKEQGEVTKEIFNSLLAKHTPELWEVGASKTSIVYANKQESKLIARLNDSMFSHKFTEGEAEANAARIVECVNACSGIDNPDTFIRYAKETLESGHLHNAAYAREIVELRTKIKELDAILMMIPVPNFPEPTSIDEVPVWVLKLEAYKLSK